MWKEFNDVKNKVLVKVDNTECEVYENLLFTAQAKIFENINSHFIYIKCDCSKFLTNERQKMLKEKALLLGYSDIKHIGYVIIANKPLRGNKGAMLNKVNLLFDNLSYYETDDLTANKSVNAEELYFISKVMSEIELEWN